MLRNGIKTNNDEGVGPNGVFTKQDRRIIWGSFGNFDLDPVWDKYFESKEKYDRFRAAEEEADPDGVFTPICVKALDGQGRDIVMELELGYFSSTLPYNYIL